MGRRIVFHQETITAVAMRRVLLLSVTNLPKVEVQVESQVDGSEACRHQEIKAIDDNFKSLRKNTGPHRDRRRPLDSGQGPGW